MPVQIQTSHASSLFNKNPLIVAQFFSTRGSSLVNVRPDQQLFTCSTYSNVVGENRIAFLTHRCIYSKLTPTG